MYYNDYLYTIKEVYDAYEIKISGKKNLMKSLITKSHADFTETLEYIEQKIGKNSQKK